jgi:hypothetical protein
VTVATSASTGPRGRSGASGAVGAVGALGVGHDLTVAPARGTRSGAGPARRGGAGRRRGYGVPVRSGRRCSRSGCGQDSVATLTYVYADSTAVLGPLATYAEPHSYDLCAAHAARLTAPRGWEVVRLAVDDPGTVGPSKDDLLALVEAVREAARPRPEARGVSAAVPGGPGDVPRGGDPGPGGPGRSIGRRGHLRVLGPVDPEVPPDG